MPSLQLEDVRKIYPSGDSEIVALDHARLTVDRGELVALVGPSGSGKSTLLSIAGGLLTPSEGRVVVADQDITDLGERDRTAFRLEHLGFVFQAVNLVPFLTAVENLVVVPELVGRGGREMRARADRLLDELGMTARRDNRATDLSGGERQRVAIGRALMNEPQLVLFDEPTSALDTHLGEQVMELIVRELKQRDVSGVVVTHDQRMTHYCDRTVEIVDGRLAA